jgi:hypothetical protein
MGAVELPNRQEQERGEGSCESGGGIPTGRVGSLASIASPSVSEGSSGDLCLHLVVWPRHHRIVGTSCFPCTEGSVAKPSRENDFHDQSVPQSSYLTGPCKVSTSSANEPRGIAILSCLVGECSLSLDG